MVFEENEDRERGRQRDVRFGISFAEMSCLSTKVPVGRNAERIGCIGDKFIEKIN